MLRRLSGGCLSEEPRAVRRLEGLMDLLGAGGVERLRVDRHLAAHAGEPAAADEADLHFFGGCGAGGLGGAPPANLCAACSTPTSSHGSRPAFSSVLPFP